MSYFLGLIGAARISRIALANEKGEILKVILAPPLTIRVNESIKEHLKNTFEQLCLQAGIEYKEILSDLKSACFSMSGICFESDSYALKQILNQIGFSGDFNLTICEDVYSHLASNFLSSGGVVIAGTGSNVFLRGTDMIEPIRVDGWGSVIGDSGSGYSLGRRCLRDLFKGLDGRLPRSEILEQRILKHVGLTKVEDLIQWFYNSRKTINWRADVADLAIPLIEAAESYEDKLARSILEEGASLLLKSVIVAFDKAYERKKNFSDKPFQIILEGGIFENSKIYKELFKSKISELSNDFVEWKAVDPLYVPIVGSLALAISENKYINNISQTHLNLIDSANNLGLNIKIQEQK